MFGCTKRFFERPVKLLCPVPLSVNGIKGQPMGIHTGYAMMDPNDGRPQFTAFSHKDGSTSNSLESCADS